MEQRFPLGVGLSSCQASTKERQHRGKPVAEAAATLAWSLGLIPELPHASSPTDLELIVKVLPRIESPTAMFVKNAKLRPDSEIKAFNNSIYEMHWSGRDAYLNGREPPDDLHPVVVYQRHRAANWLYPEIVGDLPWNYDRYFDQICGMIRKENNSAGHFNAIPSHIPVSRNNLRELRR